MIKAVIIDDEQASRKALEILLQNSGHKVAVLASVHNALEAARALKSHNPDVIFLDIEMPDKDGFALLQGLKNMQVEVIFTTAHQHYAVKAFHTDAIDYLLKPIDRNELENALQKLAKRISEKRNGETILPDTEEKQIALASANGVDFVHLADIVYLKGEGAYTDFFLKNGERKTVSKNLKEFERQLGGKGFYRIHKSFIINLQEMKKYEKGAGNLLMSNGHKVDVSKRRKEGFSTELSAL